MEPIVLREVFNRADFLNAYAWRVQLHFRKMRIQSAWFAVAALFFFVVDFLLRRPGQGFSIFFHIGAMIILSVLIVFFGTGRWKQSFFKKLNEEADQLEQTEVGYTFSEKSVLYCDKGKTLELDWHMFTGYFFYQGYLFLKIKNSFLTSYAFAEKEIDPVLFNAFAALIKANVPYTPLKK